VPPPILNPQTLNVARRIAGVSDDAGDAIRQLVRPVPTQKTQWVVSAPADQVLEKVRKSSPPPMTPLSLFSKDVPYPAEGFDPIPLLRHEGAMSPEDMRRARRATASLGDALDAGLEQGWGAWHNTGPMQDLLRSLYPTVEKADTALRDINAFTSAASNATGVEKELMKGTLYRYLAMDRMDMPKFDNLRDATEWAYHARDSDLIPEGYGSHAQGNDLLAISRYFDAGRQFARSGKSGEAYKVASYHANKMGDLNPATLDTWMYRLQGVKPGKSQNYGYLEKLLGRLAAERGIKPGEAQPAIWMQKGPDVGIDSLEQPSFLHYLEEMVRRRAAQLGEHPEDVLRAVMLGNQYLATPQSWADGIS
jgi:hypothetical protein